MAKEPAEIADLRRTLGAKLATFRQAAQLTQGQLAKVAICDRTTLVHIEKGRAGADERFWQAVDEACDAGGALVAAYAELVSAKAEVENLRQDRHLAAVQARAAALRTGRPRLPHAAAVPALDGLRRALLGHYEPPASDISIEESVREGHRRYQMADYDGAALVMPNLVSRLESPGISPHVKAAAYLAAAKLATKLGDAGLAWVAADRTVRLALEAGQPGLLGIANYQLACALLSSGHTTDAERTAAVAAEDIARADVNSADTLSARGALILLLAVLAAKREDVAAAQRNLRDAQELASRLGRDRNRLWTAFGPTNVSIHELAVYVAIGDSRKAARLGEMIDVDVLPPALSGRRSQVHLELAMAATGQRDDSLAVLHLLEAERIAEQSVSRNVTGRGVLTELLDRERKGATPGLRSLAARAGLAV